MIRKVNVERKLGFWTHPNLPVDLQEENITKEQFDLIETDNNLKIHFVRMEEDENCEFVERWFSEWLSDCSPWEPTKPTENSFLLSIHDTEDGPVAWFAEPIESK